ncbi:MAG: hypothetical protein WDO56_35230 [Gammaproteobacteria bacterium]
MNSTAPEFHEYVLGLRTAEVSAGLSFHEDDQLWHTNVFARARRGLYHLEGSYKGDAPSPAKLIRDARIYGRFSHRPVRMGRYFDASMRFGVLELLRHWCEERQVDVVALMHRAHPGELPNTSVDLEGIREQARWEGIVYPSQWTLALSRELARALLEVGYREVAQLIGRALVNTP